MVLEEWDMRTRRKSDTFERAALAFVQLLAFGGVAVGEPEAVRIDYSAPAVCPDAMAFLRSLRDRTTRFRQAAATEKARSFRVRVMGQASSFSGRLEIVGPDDSTAVRTVESRSCGEVSNALALITALAIDPYALAANALAANALAPNALAPNAPSGHSRSGETEPGGLTARSSTGPEPPRPSPPPTVTTSSRVATDASVGSPPWRWSAGLQGHTTFAVTPDLGYGGDLFVDAEASDSSPLGPAARMGVFLNQSVVELPTGPAARFRWIAPGVEGCPVRLRATGLRLAIHPCLAFRMGILYGEGQSMTRPKQVTSLWADFGPLLRLRIEVAARMNVEVQGALMLPLYRPTFTILDNGTDTRAFSVPAIGGSVAIGVSYGFR